MHLSKTDFIFHRIYKKKYTVSETQCSTVDSPNSKCLNSKQSLISKHFWWHLLFYNIYYKLNSKLHKICQPLISKLKFWNFPLFYRIIYAIYVNKRYSCPRRQCLAFVMEYFGYYSLSKQRFKMIFKNSLSV